MKRSIGWMTLAGGALLATPSVADEAAAPRPPVAKRIEHPATLHGDKREDPYFWLREKTNPEVLAYVQAENAYTESMMKATEPFQEQLYKEMLGRIQETDLSVPYRLGGFLYYSRTEQGKAYPIYCRRMKSIESPEEILIDVNDLARGEKFMSVGDREVSDDGKLYAYTTDNTGFREYRLFVKDLASGRLLPESVEKVSSVAWATDNRTLFYVVDDHAKRPYRLYRHRLGSPVSSDALVYEEKDELFRIGIMRSRSLEYLFLDSSSHTADEWRYLSASDPSGEWKLLAAREKDHEYQIDHRGDLFYIRTNGGGCRNFRVVTASVGRPARENWKEIVPCRASVMVSGLALFAEHMVLYEREGGLPRFRITELSAGSSHDVAFPEPVYSAFPEANPEFQTRLFRFNYQSLTVPPTVYDYDVRTRERTLLKRTPVLGGYDPANYVSERRWATASDGTKVPISVVYRKGLEKDGKNPAMLTGYGSYGAPSFPTFNSNRVTLLDRGFVYAIAHIRGGGEMGKPWHDAGKMMSKKNTFNDFIAAAETLVAEKYTSADRLVIEGGSAGGLLMGAVANMRPDLFHVVILRVPFVDVINTMLDDSLPLTVTEFEEWGNPKVPSEYAYIRSYSPYDNIAARSYPAMLVKTSWNDSQVMYWEPAKYVARMRATRTDHNPLLFKVNLAGGHGGSSGRYDRLRETAFDYAFVFSQLGIKN
ncbi:MAG TPA: S9 family peptidase [Thermoanaerobaculia bacterium]|nr:S9 family peptidase [Thermoanaerobaculia bacterium]